MYLLGASLNLQQSCIGTGGLPYAVGFLKSARFVFPQTAQCYFMSCFFTHPPVCMS